MDGVLRLLRAKFDTARALFEKTPLAGGDPVAALAMIAAYEVQAADIAASKGDGLRRHYGFDAEGTAFWDVHRDQEVVRHGGEEPIAGMVGNGGGHS